MGVCKQCGSKYSFWDSTGTGLCLPCAKIHSQKKIEADIAEAKSKLEKEEEQASIHLPQLFSRYCPGERANVLGAALWDNWRSKADTLHSHALMSIICLPGFKYHRKGLMAVTDSELLVVEMGSTHQYLTTSELLGTVEKPIVRKFDLRQLRAGCNSDHGILALAGKLNILAIFPPTIGTDNPPKAFSIANAINKGHLRVCPSCRVTYNIEEYAQDAPAWKCTVCKIELKKELLD